MIPIHEQMQILMRGVSEVVPAEELKTKLTKSLQNSVPLRVKLGVDPTAPDVHLGHTVVMRKLAQFQKLGHTVVLIVGDYTATVGDPSGRAKTRPRLSHEEVLAHAVDYQNQFFQIVDKNRTEIVFNGNWFKSMTFDAVTRLMSQMTVAQMLEREDFQNRYRSGQPISLHEFLYPLMQGYDSLMIRADVEIGGTDQKFNVLRGREIQAQEGQEPQIGLFMPILLGTDGREKMSKSLGNYVGVSEKADIMYHKVYNIADSLLPSWFQLLTDFPAEQVNSWLSEMQNGQRPPREIKEILAGEIVRQYHGEQAAAQARAHEQAVHTGSALPSDAEPVTLASGSHAWPDLLVQIGASTSKGEARKLMVNGGVRLNGEKQENPQTSVVLESGEKQLLQVGKRRYFVLHGT